MQCRMFQRNPPCVEMMRNSTCTSNVHISSCMLRIYSGLIGGSAPAHGNNVRRCKVYSFRLNGSAVSHRRLTMKKANESKPARYAYAFMRAFNKPLPIAYSAPCVQLEPLPCVRQVLWQHACTNTAEVHVAKSNHRVHGHFRCYVVALPGPRQAAQHEANDTWCRRPHLWPWLPPVQ